MLPLPFALNRPGACAVVPGVGRKPPETLIKPRNLSLIFGSRTDGSYSARVRSSATLRRRYRTDRRQVTDIPKKLLMEDKSSILIITTGGTIGIRDRCRHGALVPFDFGGIYEEFPSLKRLNVAIDVVTMSPVIDSSNVARRELDRLWPS